jgi:hypothetical protein
MSARLPRPSAPPGAAPAPGRSVFRCKIVQASQRQREQAFLMARVDKSRKPVIDKSRDMISRAAPVTPSFVERANHQLHRSQMKQLNSPLHASTLSPILDLPESTTPLPIAVVRLPPIDAPTNEDIVLPPTVERISLDEPHEAGGGVILDQVLIRTLLHPFHLHHLRHHTMGRHSTTITIPLFVALRTVCVALWATKRLNS